MEAVEQYLEKTGQTLTELLEGASTFGPAFIQQELVPKALAQNKKIIWVPVEIDGEDLGQVQYRLEDL